MSWWKNAVIYQIYPRSFADSNGDGIGDLRGVIERFEYLVELGIDAIWFSPFFKSPQKDFGYDVENYYEIDPVYGTMADFDELLNLAHEHNIKILLDLVLNHTSDQHPWFKESRKSRDNPYRDFYIWKDGKKPHGKKPPNNWKSFFGGSAWTYDEKTEQWYYHHFLPEQPDLNYRNPKVKEEMFKVVKFWLDKGVDGFRLDVIHLIYEDPSFRDNPRSWRLFPSDYSNAWLFQEHKYDESLEETVEFVRELRKLVDSYKEPERVLLGEVLGIPERVRLFYGPNNDGLHLNFNFTFTSCPFKAEKFYNVVKRIEKTLPEPYWPCYTFSNHDIPRMISRHGNDEKKARLLTLMLLTLRGTPVIYYGEEIGMQQVKIPRKKVQDPLGKKFWFSPVPIGRDGCRTPMQWEDSANSGFSSCEWGKTWLPVHKNYKKINVKLQRNDPHSLFNFYIELIRFRKRHIALQIGKIKLFPPKKSIFYYIRETESDVLLIVLNMSKKACSYNLKDLLPKHEENSSIQALFSTHEGKIGENELLAEKLTLKPLEGCIYRLFNKNN